MINEGWERSSFCADQAHCVEVKWVKSSYSNGSGGSNCVEVGAGEDDQILVRDSKDPDGPVLAFTRAEWDAFTAGVRDGEFRFS